MTPLLFLVSLLSFVLAVNAFALRSGLSHSSSRSLQRVQAVSAPAVFEIPLALAARRKDETNSTGVAWLMERLDKANKDPNNNNRKPPFYEPGPFPQKLIAAAAYIVPLVDAADMGKYVFAAYPQIGEVFNSAFGPLAAVYNGVPFLPFAIFFLMSYISRAPSFPIEVRFHFAQAFIISLVQFVPSLLLGLAEKASVPGVAVLFNAVFFWVAISCLTMQSMIIMEPILQTKNPLHYNVYRWAFKYMNYSLSDSPRRKK
eukprot:gene28754-34715_t